MWKFNFKCTSLAMHRCRNATISICCVKSSLTDEPFMRTKKQLSTVTAICQLNVVQHFKSFTFGHNNLKLCNNQRELAAHLEYANEL